VNLKDTLGAENQEAPVVPAGAGCKERSGGYGLRICVRAGFRSTKVDIITKVQSKN